LQMRVTPQLRCARHLPFGPDTFCVDGRFVSFGGASRQRRGSRESSCSDSVRPSRATGRLEPGRYRWIHETDTRARHRPSLSRKIPSDAAGKRCAIVTGKNIPIARRWGCSPSLLSTLRCCHRIRPLCWEVGNYSGQKIGHTGVLRSSSSACRKAGGLCTITRRRRSNRTLVIPSEASNLPRHAASHKQNSTKHQQM
jgi:hypothetical protein